MIKEVSKYIITMLSGIVIASLGYHLVFETLAPTSTDVFVGGIMIGFGIVICLISCGVVSHD